MRYRVTILFVTALLAKFLLGWAPQVLLAQQLSDKVFPISGVPADGTVVDMTRSGVVLDVGGTKRTIGVNEIRRVNFATDPPELRQARDAADRGAYEDVKNELSAIDTSAVEGRYVPADIDFYRSYADAKLALAGKTDKEAAHTALYDFIRNNSQNFHFFDAAELLGDLAIARGKFAEAQTYYGSLSQAESPQQQLRAATLQAKAMIPQKKFDDAMKMYESVINSPLATPEINREKQLAQVGRAVCLAETGDIQQAEQVLTDIIRNNDPRDVVLFGRTYNALGAVHRKKGESKAALLDYLHTDLQFYGEAETHAEALYYLSKLWADAANNADRALQAKNLLKSRYAGTLWAQLQ